MTTSHHDPRITAMIQELPMRSDLSEMPLAQDTETAEAQLLIRQAVPVPMHETLITRIKALVKSMLN